MQSSFEEAFYEKKDLDPSMHAHAAGKTVELPTDVDAELLAKVLSNLEMAALLSTLAKSLEKKIERKSLIVICGEMVAKLATNDDKKSILLASSPSFKKS